MKPADARQNTMVEVALSNSPGERFTYAYPFAGAAPAGMRVLVPWRRQLRVGILLGETSSLPPDLRPEKVRPIVCLLDAQPLVSPELLSLLAWAAKYYQASFGELLQCALPPDLVLPRRLLLTDAGKIELARLSAAVGVIGPPQMSLPSLQPAAPPASG